MCCDSKCIKKTDLCECDRYPKIRPHVIGMSHSSCGRSDDELPFSEKAKKKLLEKLAESALRIPNKTKQTIRLLNSSNALREIYIQLKYQCCEKLTLDCCAWGEEINKKLHLNGPISGCFMITDFTSIIHGLEEAKLGLCQ